MNRRDLDRLRQLADLHKDHKLAKLRAAIDARTRSEEALAALALPMPMDAGLLGAAADLAGLAYQRWADIRRAEINLDLASQMRDVIAARAEAEHAFARSEALASLANRQKPPQGRG